MAGKRVLIMAGGTGGHVFPALAVAEALRARNVTITWLGTRRGIESRLVPQAGLPINYIDIGGLRGKSGVASKLKAPWRLIKAVWQALRVVRRECPDAVLGFGGFAAGPGGLAAWLLRKPLIIHEQNAIAGTTNRILARLAKRRLSGFPDSLPGAEYCGNPVRGAICGLAEPDARGLGAPSRRLHLLVLGGSLGALAINQAMPATMALINAQQRPAIRHQTGKDHLDATHADYVSAGVDAETVAFIDDMAAAYAWADLVICRAGALTIAELTAVGVGSVLIPYPHAIDDHQTANARWLVAQGAAVLLPQTTLNTEPLRACVQDLLNDRRRLLAMASAAYQLRSPGAASAVADVCVEVMV